MGKDTELHLYHLLCILLVILLLNVVFQFSRNIADLYNDVTVPPWITLRTVPKWRVLDSAAFRMGTGEWACNHVKAVIQSVFLGSLERNDGFMEYVGLSYGRYSRQL